MTKNGKALYGTCGDDIEIIETSHGHVKYDPLLSVFSKWDYYLFIFF